MGNSKVVKAIASHAVTIHSCGAVPRNAGFQSAKLDAGNPRKLESLRHNRVKIYPAKVNGCRIRSRVHSHGAVAEKGVSNV